MLTACQSTQQPDTPPTVPTLPAVYIGSWQQAGSKGIEVALTLADTLHATFLTTPIGEGSPQQEAGTYALEDSSLHLTLKDRRLLFAYTADKLTLLPDTSKGSKAAPATAYELHKRKAYDYAGQYTQAADDVTDSGYFQSLTITPKEGGYHVSFTASTIKGKPNCRFSGFGKVRNDTLFVPLGAPHDSVELYIAPRHDEQGVEVFTQDTEQRYALMWYCGGGGSLAGEYLKMKITPEAIGSIAQGQTFADVLRIVPSLQIAHTQEEGEFADDRYDNYTLCTRHGQPLLTLSPKQGERTGRIERILVHSPLFTTAEGIGAGATYGQIKQAYPTLRIEPDKDHIVVIVDALHARFAIAKKQLSEGWWDEQAQTVRPEKIPDSAPIEAFTLWWE